MQNDAYRHPECKVDMEPAPQTPPASNAATHAKTRSQYCAASLPQSGCTGKTSTGHVRTGATEDQVRSLSVCYMPKVFLLSSDKTANRRAARPPYATKAEAVDDSYFQLGASFFTRCIKENRVSTACEDADCSLTQVA